MPKCMAEQCKRTPCPIQKHNQMWLELHFNGFVLQLESEETMDSEIRSVAQTPSQFKNIIKCGWNYTWKDFHYSLNPKNQWPARQGVWHSQNTHGLNVEGSRQWFTQRSIKHDHYSPLCTQPKSLMRMVYGWIAVANGLPNINCTPTKYPTKIDPAI